MIDTVRILTKIDKEIYNIIHENSIIKNSFNAKTGEIYYSISSNHLPGSYSSSLFVRAYDRGEKFGFADSCVLVVERSVHKLVFGQNAYNGFYDLKVVVDYLKFFVENAYCVKLPNYERWYLLRIDIAKCFDLGSQNNVCKYINSLSNLDFPRRNLKYYKDSCIYFTGTTTTLKIYNKLLEFKAHDRSKLLKINSFNLEDHENIISNFVRLELEIKKKKLLSLFQKINGAIVKNVRCIDFNYDILVSIWVDEFMKVLKVNLNGLKKVSDKDLVKERLYSIYGENYGNNLYNFYLSLCIDGCKSVRKCMSKSTYYRKINDLKNADIDFVSNKISVVYNSDNCFVDIFQLKEVA